jgi:hypothetical protein
MTLSYKQVAFGMTTQQLIGLHVLPMNASSGLQLYLVSQQQMHFLDI